MIIAGIVVPSWFDAIGRSWPTLHASSVQILTHESSDFADAFANKKRPAELLRRGVNSWRYSARKCRFCQPRERVMRSSSVRFSASANRSRATWAMLTSCSSAIAASFAWAAGGRRIVSDIVAGGLGGSGFLVIGKRRRVIGPAPGLVGVGLARQ